VNPAKNIHPWSKDLDFRMWSVCTYNFWNGEANACTVDNDIATDEKGYYTLVLSEEQNRPDNARPQDGVTWLNTGNYLDGQISYRMLPKRSRFLTQLAADLKSNANSEYLPKTAFCSKAEFENGGFETCLKSGSN